MAIRLVSTRSLTQRFVLLCLLFGCSSREGRMESPLVSEQSAALADARSPKANVADRQLIRTVTLDMEVESLWSARQKAEALTREAGGFVESLDSSRAGRTQQLALDLRVPRDALDRTVASMRKLGRTTRESQQVEDVTRKYVDADARFRNMQRTEQRLLSLLEGPNAGLADVLAVERELGRVREESEVLDAELRALKEQVALSTLKLRFSQEADAEAPESMWTPWRRLGRNAGAILAESLAALVGFFAALLTGALYLLPWLPLGALGFYGLRRLRRWRKARRQPPS